MVARKPSYEAVRVSRPLDYLRLVMDSRDLISSERLVALAIMRHAGPDGRKSHPGIRLLMAETDLSENTIIRAARSLVGKKWLIQIYSGRGGRHDRSNEYDLARPVPKTLIPNLNDCGLEGSQTSTEGSQTSTEVFPNLTGGVTDAPRDAPRNAPTSPTLDPSIKPERTLAEKRAIVEKYRSRIPIKGIKEG